ncbi:MAG: hypothetical protein II276_03980 [Bacteroidales bacterium]|nr:hypothetical protein [Bacteroidales bacterium]
MIAQNQKEFLVNRVVDKLTEFLVVDSNIDIAEALKVVYNSKVYQQLQDSEGDLYVQSPSYIYEMLKQEMDVNMNNNQ